MHIKKSDAKRIENSSDCIVFEYPFDSELLSMATATITGRYPASGRAVNNSCEEVYYVISGSGKIVSEKGTFNVEQGDVYHFTKGEKFFVEGDRLVVVLVNAPKWTEEQHEISFVSDQFMDVFIEEDILYLVWKSETSKLTDELFKVQAQKFIEVVKENKTLKICVDMREFKYSLSEEIISWRNEHIIQVYNSIGVSHFGFISTTATVKQDSPENTFITRSFLNKNDATVWLKGKKDKVILVDAINCFVTKEGMFKEMHELLEQYPHKKIVLTGATKERQIEFKLHDLPYPFFSLEHNPDKSEPEYYHITLKYFSLKAENVIYFEHSLKAVESARSVGIKTYHYNKDSKDLEQLKKFLDENLQ